MILGQVSNLNHPGSWRGIPVHAHSLGMVNFVPEDLLLTPRLTPGFNLQLPNTQISCP